MGKKSSNPFNTLKTAINTAGDNVSKTYTSVSKDISNTASKIIPVKPKESDNSEEKKILPEIKTVKHEIESEKKIIKPEKSPLEKQIESQYIGCYSDDPSNPSMEHYLGEISNSLECIELGKKNNYKYVGLQQGNKCFASNKLPNTKEVDKNEFCNVGCDDIDSGNCGGFFYNQVYKTNILTENLQHNNNNKHIKKEDKDINDESNKINDKVNNIKDEANSILENFISSDNEMEKINYGLSHVDCSCWDPINSYVLFTWVVILIILLYLLFEYLYKKQQKNI